VRSGLGCNQNVGAQLGGNSVELVIRQFGEQFVVGPVRTFINAGRGWRANVEILIRQLRASGSDTRHQPAVTVDGRVEARHEQLLDLWRRLAKRQRLEWTGLWNDFEDPRYQPGANTRFVIFGLRGNLRNADRAPAA
jgi:hypothetical protein